jgi:hypothetical protein
MLLHIKNLTAKELGDTFRDLRVEVQVKQFCRTKLFHFLKFINSRSELGQLSNPTDIGNVIMDNLNVNDVTVRPRWWLLYQDVVRKALDTQRSNCNMALKPVMIGTLRVLLKTFF